MKVRVKAVLGAMFWARNKVIFDVLKTSASSNVRTSNRLAGAFFSTGSRYFGSSVSRYSESQGGMVSEEVKDPVRGTTTTGMPSSRRGQQRMEDSGGDEEDSHGGVTGFVSEKAKEGTKKAAETVVEVGEKTKEAADEAWEAVKETTHKIKDAVAGDIGDRNEDYDRHGPTDSHVDDLRKRAGCYDLRKD